jgi:phage terminase large subunit
MYYKNALIGIESNFDSFPIRELTRLGYTKQFVRNEEDTYTGKLQKRFGFRTDRNSRPRIISNLIEIVREHTNQINDKETLEEMLTFVRNEKGRPEAQEGAHDDLVMGLAIAYEIQGQVVFNEEPITVEQVFNFSIEEPEEEDWGSEVSII